MTYPALILWVVSVLSASTTLATLNNHQLDIANYAYLAAVENNVNPDKFLKLINCESKLQEKAKGDFRSETGEFMARGILQFWPGTFEGYSTIYGIEGTRDDPYASIDVAVRMIAGGGWHHWENCGKKAGFQYDYK